MSFPSKLKNFNFTIDGESVRGTVGEVNLPKISRKMEEWRGGGMDRPVDVDLGGELLTIEHSYGGFMVAIAKQMCLPSAAALTMRFSGAYVNDAAASTDSIEVVIRGRHKEIDHGKQKAGDDTEFKVVSSLVYYKLSVNGQVIHEIDVLGFKEIVDGVDRLAEQRKAMNL